MLTSPALPIPGLNKVEMDRRAERRKHAAFTIVYVVFFVFVIVTLLWALGML
jgi:hypothetical protein